jgi:hypothetical protein
MSPTSVRVHCGMLKQMLLLTHISGFHRLEDFDCCRGYDVVSSCTCPATFRMIFPPLHTAEKQQPSGPSECWQLPVNYALLTQKNTNKIYLYCFYCGDGVVQSVYRRATGWTARVQFPAVARNFSLRHSAQTGSGVHLASYPKSTGGHFTGLKRPGGETGHWPPSSAKIEKSGAIHPHTRMSSCHKCLID